MSEQPRSRAYLRALQNDPATLRRMADWLETMPTVDPRSAAKELRVHADTIERHRRGGVAV